MAPSERRGSVRSGDRCPFAVTPRTPQIGAGGYRTSLRRRRAWQELGGAERALVAWCAAHGRSPEIFCGFSVEWFSTISLFSCATLPVAWSGDKGCSLSRKVSISQPRSRLRQRTLHSAPIDDSLCTPGRFQLPRAARGQAARSERIQPLFELRPPELTGNWNAP